MKKTRSISGSLWGSLLSWLRHDVPRGRANGFVGAAEAYQDLYLGRPDPAGFPGPALGETTSLVLSEPPSGEAFLSPETRRPGASAEAQ